MSKKAKTMDEVKADMSELYDDLRDGKVDLKKASEMANVAGKLLKGEQLKLAREIFENELDRVGGKKLTPGSKD